MALIFFILFSFTGVSLLSASEIDDAKIFCQKELSLGDVCNSRQLVYNIFKDKESMKACVQVFKDDPILCRNPYLAKQTQVFPEEISLCYEISNNLDDSCIMESVLKSIRLSPDIYVTCVKELNISNMECTHPSVMNALKKSRQAFAFCTQNLKKSVFECSDNHTLKLITENKTRIQQCIGLYPQEVEWCYEFISTPTFSCIRKLGQCFNLVVSRSGDPKNVDDSDRSNSKSSSDSIGVDGLPEQQRTQDSVSK